MKLNYYPDTDSLYIDLSEQTSVESREISEGVVLDYDTDGNLVGIDIDNASTKVQLEELRVQNSLCSSPREAAPRSLTQAAASLRRADAGLPGRAFHRKRPAISWSQA